MTHFLLVIRIQYQLLDVLMRTEKGSNWQSVKGFVPWKRIRISSSRFGIGQQNGSNQTPLGLHRIANKIGGGWPVGTVFRHRQMVGFTWKGLPSSPIVHRILWLEGLEPGFNQGGNVDSHSRYIYIHCTSDEPGLSRPSSRGCIHVSAKELLPLFDRIPSGSLVWIQVGLQR